MTDWVILLTVYSAQRLVEGRSPADLLVELSIKFEFIINLKAAKQIGLTILPKRAGAGG